MTKHTNWKIQAIELFEKQEADKNKQQRLDQEARDAEQGQVLNRLLSELLGEDIHTDKGMVEVEDTVFRIGYAPGQPILGAKPIQNPGFGGRVVPTGPPTPYVSIDRTCVLCEATEPVRVSSLLEIGATLVTKYHCRSCASAQAGRL